MRRFKGFWSLIIIALLAVGGLAYTFSVGNKPLLGLDLQGGVSVVLKPVNDVTDDTLEQAISIIRQRIDALGVAEPEITRQGQNILIQIPGVKDKDRALALVGQTAELQFRPVLASIPAGAEALPTDPGTTPTPADPADPATTPSGSVPDTTEQGLGAAGVPLGLGETAGGSGGAFESAQAETPTTQAPTTDGPIAPGVTLAPPAATTATGLPADVCTTGIPSSDIPPDQVVVLPECRDGQLVATYQLGPVSLTGSALSSASAGLDQGGRWTVNPVFKGGADGIDLFNSAAAQCFSRAATCPTGQLGIVLDGRVISAPVIQTGSFQADQIQISGTFTEGEANDLATSLRYGALPVELEQQQALRRLGHPRPGRPARRPHRRRRRPGAGGALHDRLLPLPRPALAREAGHRGCSALDHHQLPGHEQRSGPHAGRRDRHHRVDRCLARLERRVLRAPQGRRPQRAQHPQSPPTSRSCRRSRRS